MTLTLASIIVTALTAYMVLGLIVAPIVVFLGARHLDPAARSGTIGFKLLILPGMMVFWPLMLSRWVRGMATPPEERNCHREASRRGSVS